MEQKDQVPKPNQLRALLGLAKASFVASMRNKTTVFFNFFFPFIFITIFGIISGGNLTFAVGIRQGSLRAGTFYEAMKKVDTFRLVTDKTDAQLQDMLYKGQIPAVVTIESVSGLSGNGNISPKYNVTIERSGADPNSAETVATILNNITQKINSPPQVKQYQTISLEEKVVQGHRFKQIDFILPGQLSFALLVNALFGISFAFMTLKRQLVIKRIFASPTSRSTLLASEIISRMGVAILQALIIVLVGHFLFGFTLAHGVLTVGSLIVLSIIGILVFLSFGLLVPSIAKDENAVAPISNIIMMPQLFLSGAFFQIELFPKLIQPIARILPMTFLNDAVKKVAFEGAPLQQTSPQIFGLLVWAVVIYLIDIKLFKWE